MPRDLHMATADRTCFGGDAPFHGIQDALRTALGADPHPKATHFGEGFDDLRIQPIGARNALERQLQSAPLEFRGVLKKPAVMNGENVIGHPRHFGLVSIDQPLEFVGHRCRLPAAVRLAEYFVAAPAAMVGAAASGDKRHRAHPVMLAPDRQVPRQIDRFARGPRLSIDVVGSDLAEACGRSVPSEVRKAMPLTVRSASAECERQNGYQFFQRDFSLADHDDIRPSFEVFIDVRARLWAADNRLPSGILCDAQNLDDVRARHQICVDAEHRRRTLLKQFKQLLARRECRIEYLDVQAFASQMRANVQDPQWRVGLHDLKLFGILVKEITVGKEYVHVAVCDQHDESSRRRTSCQVPPAIARGACLATLGRTAESSVTTRFFQLYDSLSTIRLAGHLPRRDSSW